ncbi:SDR family oxidoreductase [bacterium]|nr:SDR family oxidoreductase [bacterium]
MGLLKGKTAIVTGGGTGIGRAVALRFAAEGCRVVVCGRRMDKLNETVAASGPLAEKLLALPCDLTDRAQILGLVKTATDKLGGLDILVNNAGAMRFADLSVAGEDMYDLLMETNVRAVWHLCQAVIPHLKARGGGSIVTISSVAGLKAMSGAGLYCMSKAAVQMLSQTLAIEHAADQIRVNVVCPALVEETELAEPIVGKEGMQAFYDKLRASHPLGRNGRPDDIADAVLYFAGDCSRWVTGTVLPVDGGRMLTSARPKV